MTKSVFLILGELSAGELTMQILFKQDYRKQDMKVIL